MKKSSRQLIFDRILAGQLRIIASILVQVNVALNEVCELLESEDEV